MINDKFYFYHLTSKAVEGVEVGKNKKHQRSFSRVGKSHQYFSTESDQAMIDDHDIDFLDRSIFWRFR